MPFSNMPEMEVSIAFNSGYTTAAASRTWTDVTAYVEGQISIARGRQDEFTSVNPSTCTLTLDNTDGRFTPEYAAGAYYPNVKKGRPIRVRARWPVTTGTWYDLFTGYVDTWPVEWPGGTTTYSSATVTATSRMARLGRGSAFKSIVEEEILYDVPVLYFPLGEPEGALEAGNTAANQRPERLVVTQVGTGGTLAFGAGIGPGTDGLTAPIFTPASAGNGLYLAATPVEPLSTSTALGVDIFFVTSTASQVLASLRTKDATAFIEVGIDASSHGYISVRDKAGVVKIATVTSTTVTDGNLHMISGVAVISGGTTITPSLQVDGGTRASGSAGTWTGSFPLISRVLIGASDETAAAVLFNGTLAHAVIYANASGDARGTERYNAGANGFNTEASGARISRYARLAGIPTAEVIVEPGLSTSIAHIDTTGQAPVSLMQTVADTEDGIDFDGRDGTLTFQGRSHRYGATSAFTLDCSLQEVEADLHPVLDDQNMVNDMTASRAGGATIRSVNQASIDEGGFYRETVELVTTSDNEVQSRADWAVNRFGTPRVKVTSIAASVLASSSAQTTLLLAVDLGTRFTVSNLPAQAPASSMQFFIEGIGYEISEESFTITFNTSAAAYADVWILDSTTFSVLDSTTVPAY